MASTSEGRNAIEAAKLRLAAAKSQTLATSKTLASAEASEACAKQMAEVATKNARAAASCNNYAKCEGASGELPEGDGGGGEISEGGGGAM